jgi:putative ABC transport system permease protein
VYPVQRPGLQPPQNYVPSPLIADAGAVSLLLGERSGPAVSALAAGRPVVFGRGRPTVRTATARLTVGTGPRPGTVTLHAVVIGTDYGLPSIVLPPAYAASLGVRTVPTSVLIAQAGGVSAAQEQALAAALYRIDRQLVVEIPHVYQDRYAAARTAFVLGGGIIAVVAAVISTALARLERRADLRTLAAVGAAPSMRWRMAMTQGAVIAGVGTLLGTGVGFVAPIAYVVAMNRTRSGGAGDLPMPLTVPWPTIGLLLVLVPAAAALCAALFGRTGGGSGTDRSGAAVLPVG